MATQQTERFPHDTRTRGDPSFSVNLIRCQVSHGSHSDVIENIPLRLPPRNKMAKVHSHIEGGGGARDETN